MTAADWVFVTERLPLIPAGKQVGAYVICCVEFPDRSRDWLRGRMIAVPDGYHRWQISTAGSCRVIAWQPGPELPEMGR